MEVQLAQLWDGYERALQYDREVGSLAQHTASHHHGPACRDLVPAASCGAALGIQGVAPPNN